MLHDSGIVTGSQPSHRIEDEEQKVIPNGIEENKQVDADQLSLWSEDQMQHAMSQRDAQNPQEQREEEKEQPSELRVILEHSSAQVQRQNNQVDQELAELTRGGVAAINRQSAQQRLV